jgi:hypothetical protein
MGVQHPYQYEVHVGCEMWDFGRRSAVSVITFAIMSVGCIAVRLGTDVLEVLSLE